MTTIRVLGGGWYGCHLAAALVADGHDVVLMESADQLFAGASGGNPARLHQGFHYPRSRLTRAACQDHAEAFQQAYGFLTRPIPVNLYAVAADDSLVDFGTYRDTMRSAGVEFLTVAEPAAYGLAGVEGALLTGERHIVIDEARLHFAKLLGDRVKLRTWAQEVDDSRFITIDCTFCALDAEAVDRYEPCVTVLLEGPTDKAVTVMDGPFPSIYPWNEELGLCSLTSASLTPLTKTCRTYAEARALLAATSPGDLGKRAFAMLEQAARYWPAAMDLFRITDMRFTVRAMPRSGADARLVDVVKVGAKALRVRAGKIDAVFRAEHLVKEALCSL